MAKYRFRRTEDLDIEADSPEEAWEKLAQQDKYPEDYELLGQADIENLSPKFLDVASEVSGFCFMAIQYRGENFACLCKTEDLGTHVSMQPIALMLSEEQKQHIENVLGDRPEAGLRKKLNLEEGEQDE